MALIIAGKVYVDEDKRDRFIEGHRVIVERAREYPGCLDVAITADSVEPGRVNLYEYWESAEALAAWRKVSPRPTGRAKMRDVEVHKHDITATRGPFD